MEVGVYWDCWRTICFFRYEYCEGWSSKLLSPRNTDFYPVDALHMLISFLNIMFCLNFVLKLSVRSAVVSGCGDGACSTWYSIGKGPCMLIRKFASVRWIVRFFLLLLSLETYIFREINSFTSSYAIGICGGSWPLDVRCPHKEIFLSVL